MKYLVEVWVTRSYLNLLEVEADDSYSAGLKAEDETLEGSDEKWEYKDVSCNAANIHEAHRMSRADLERMLAETPSEEDEKQEGHDEAFSDMREV